MWSTAKTAGLFIIFGLSLISVIIPCLAIRCLVGKLGASSKFKRVVGYLNCFSGGIFFATSILDLLPEARESMEKVHIGIDFPLTECIMGTGFLCILLLEHVAHMCCSNTQSSREKSNAMSQKAGRRKKSSESNTTVGYYKRTDSQVSDSTPNDDVIIVRDFEDSSDVSYQTYGAVGQQKPKLTRPYGIDPNLSPNKIGSEFSSPSSDTTTPSEDIKIFPGEKEPIDTSTALHFVENTARNNNRLKTLRSMILLMALSLHMVFDGLALGLQEKESDIWNLVLALGIHKVLVFFTIGLQLIEMLKSVCKTIVAGLLLALVSPLGIVIGEFITSSGGDELTKDTVSAVLQGFATGTFIFVTFFEILQQELNMGDHDIFKVLATIVGFSVIAVVKLFVHE